MGRRFILEEIDDETSKGGCLQYIIFMGVIIGLILFWDAYIRDDITKHPEDIEKLNEYITEIKEIKTQDQYLLNSKSYFLERLQEFRNHGNPNCSDITPLHYACRFEHYELVKFLVEHGANVNKRGGWNSNPPLLWVKGNSSNAEMIREYLKSKGAKENP